MGGREVEWVDADGAALPTEEIELGTGPWRRRRVRLVAAAAVLLVLGAAAFVLTRGSERHAPPVTRASSRPAAPVSHELPLTSVLVPTGSFTRTELAAAGEEYRLSMQNVSSHVLGPVGDIQVLFPGALNGTVVSTEFLPEPAPSSAPAADRTPDPISFIQPGERVQLLVSFSWFCADRPVRRPRTGPTTLRAEVEMAAFRTPGVYALDDDAPPGEDAFSLYRAFC